MVRLGQRDTRPEWLIALLALGILGVGLGLRDPWPADEPRFVLIARQMWESGDWLFPMRGNEHYPDKPPLFFWLLNFAFALTGSWRTAFLLPALLSGLLTLWMLYDLARRLHGLRAARLAAVTLLVVVQFAFQMKRAQIDPVLLALMTAAHYGLLRHLLLGPAFGWATVGAFCAGLATITKGVGPLSLLLLLSTALAMRRWPRRLPLVSWWDVRWLAVAAAFLIAIALWLVPLLLAAHGDAGRTDYVKQILLGQTAQRYLAPSSHLQPFWYFGPMMVVQWLPLSLLLPWLLPAWRRRLSRGDGRLAAILLQFLLVLVFFSLSPGKRDVYILPLLPLAVLAAAPLLPGLLRKPVVRNGLWSFTFLVGILLCIAALWGALGQPRWALRNAVLTELQPWGVLGIMGGGALGIALACAPARWRVLAWPLVLLWLFSVLALAVFPRVDPQSSARGLMQDVGARIGSGAELGLLSWKEQNLLQADRPAVVFGFLRNRAAQELDAVAWLRAKPERRWLLVQAVNLEACFDASKAILAGTSNRRQWWLVRAEALLPVCRPHPESAHRDRRVADF